MVRSEHAANVALAQTRTPAAWERPSTCKRRGTRETRARIRVVILGTWSASILTALAYWLS